MYKLLFYYFFIFQNLSTIQINLALKMEPFFLLCSPFYYIRQYLTFYINISCVIIVWFNYFIFSLYTIYFIKFFFKKIIFLIQVKIKYSYIFIFLLYNAYTFLLIISKIKKRDFNIPLSKTTQILIKYFLSFVKSY